MCNIKNCYTRDDTDDIHIQCIRLFSASIRNYEIINAKQRLLQFIETGKFCVKGVSIFFYIIQEREIENFYCR